MPLIDLQRRIHETGRIRLGSRSGPKGAPKRLDTFRFTSPNSQAIQKVADAYGGSVEPWNDAPGEARQYQVFTDADVIDVIVPPTSMAISQHYESWSGGGVQRRCDGQREVLTDSPCICAAEMDDGKERLCKPTTRLNVMLPQVWGFGVWRLETSGWNAAAELAGAAELAQVAAMQGRLSSARLRLETRTKKSQGQTRHFVVPVLDLDLPLGVSDTSQTAGTPAAAFTPVDHAALPPWPTPSIEEQLRAVEKPSQEKPRANQAAPIPPTGLDIEHDGRAITVTEPAPEPENYRGLVDEATRKSIVIACREAGLDDEARHSFLERFSEGRYNSAKDVPAIDVASLRAELVKRKQERAAQPAETVDVPLLEQPAEEWTAARWLDTLRNVPGVGQAKLLRKARELASDLGQSLPSELGDIQDPHLVTQLLAWLKGRNE